MSDWFREDPESERMLAEERFNLAAVEAYERALTLGMDPAELLAFHRKSWAVSVYGCCSACGDKRCHSGACEDTTA